MAKINKKTILVHLLSIFLFVVIVSLSIVIINKNNNKVEYLNDIIESNDYKENKNTYLTVKSISQKFAKHKKNAYYFASDGKYNYVVYLDKEEADKLFKSDLESKPVKLYGVTKNTSNKVKELAIDTYNIDNEDNKITIEDYYSYFGDVYLDSVNVK